MDAARRDVFEKCFNNLVAQRMAVTLQDKLALVEELRQAAVEQGAVPISPHEFARVNPKSAHALAIQAGEEISLGGVSIQGQPDLRSRLTGLSNTKKMLLLLCIPAAIVLLFLLMNGAMNRTAEVSPTPTATATVTATITLTPSATPLPLAAATSYAMVLSTAQVPKGVNDPISVEFGGLAFVRLRVRPGRGWNGARLGGPSGSRARSCAGWWLCHTAPRWATPWPAWPMAIRSSCAWSAARWSSTA